MEEFFVFVLRFETPAAVEQAFPIVSDDRDIASCIVEPAELRIRFVATRERGAPLAERVAERCRLVWCSRHGLGSARPWE